MAIALDTDSVATPVSGTGTVTWTHTMGAGTNQVLIVGIQNFSSTLRTVNALTYNGVGMTLLKAANTGSFDAGELWYLVNPTTGANTVSCTLSGSASGISAGGMSFTGVDQTTPMDVVGGASQAGSGASISGSITTVTDLAWVFGTVTYDDPTHTLTCGNTQDWNSTASSHIGAGSHTGPKTPAGSQSLTWTSSANVGTPWVMVLGALRPAVTASASGYYNLIPGTPSFLR